MKIFVTGATGFIGSAVVAELLSHGYEVLGLTRSQASREKLVAMGATAITGSLDDLASLQAGARQSDGILHLAFKHDFENMRANGKTDQAAIEAMAAVIKGTNKPMVVTAGTMMLHNGHMLTEKYVPNLFKQRTSPRKSEIVARKLAKQGVNVSVVRLAPAVYAEGRAGFATLLIQSIADKNSVSYIRKGQNRWSTIHRDDAAVLFRLALEHAQAGAVYHGVNDDNIVVKDIAEKIGKHVGKPVDAVSRRDGFRKYGMFVNMIVGMDSPASNAWTKQVLGWQPTHAGLLEELEHDEYYI